jgi:polyhydroxyalkanoate synthesis regulator phasin
MDEKELPEEAQRRAIQELIERCRKMEKELDELRRRLEEMTQQAERSLKRPKNRPED